MSDHACGCIEQIQRLGFKPGTRLNIFCVSCRQGINVFSDKLNEPEIEEYLDRHGGHEDCFFGCNDGGERWQFQNNGGAKSNDPQRIELTTGTTKPEEATSQFKSEPSPETKIEKPPALEPTPSPAPDSSESKIGGGDSSEPERRASPQAEDGHVDIANELAEALAKVNLSAYESRILWAIWRKTYGWHKKTDQISITQFEKATAIKRRHVQRTLDELVKRNIVTRIGYGRIVTYGFLKDYTRWRDITKRGYDVGIPRVSGRSAPKGVISRSAPKGVIDRNLKGCPQKKLTKEKHVYCENSIELQLAILLLKEIQKNKPDFKEPNLQVWAKVVDHMLRIDKRSPDAIERVIRWAQADHGDCTGQWKGWASNILSAAKLREKFDVLEMKMRGKSRNHAMSTW